jgi:hypothetical protein
MSNTLLTNDIILKEALMEFENNLVITKTARRDYQDRFDVTTGATIRIRKPTRYTARTGRNAQPQAINEQYTNLTIGDMIGVDVEVTSQELALQIDDFNRDILSPAMVTLANKIDSLLYNTTLDIYNFVGTAGTAPNTFAVIDQAGALLDSLGVPRDNNRFLLEKSFDASATRSALYNTFNENFNKEIIMNGSMGNLAGFDAYSAQNIINPVFALTTATGVALANAGAALGTPLMNGATVSGATTLVMDGFTASITIKEGATFTISGVNSTNPTSRTDTGQLAKFVVTADTEVNGSGEVTLPIAPTLVLTGPYQNITALPANNAPVTFNFTHTKNLAYHREAFALVTVNLPVNNDGAFQKNIRDPKGTGINIRMTRQYSATSDVTLIRFDVLPAVKCFPDYASIVMGS